MSAKTITLSPSGLAIVDEADFEMLNKWRWRLHTTGHAMRLQREHYYQRGIYMHRLIMDAPAGTIVDHINGNRLDNRRCNLRLCTPAQNSRNRRGTGASSYVGVRYDKRRNKWVAEIQICRGNRKFLGSYDDEATAARAYDAAAREYDPEFTRFNFPEEISP